MTREDITDYLKDGMMALDTDFSVPLPDYFDFMIEPNGKTWNNREQEGDFWKLLETAFDFESRTCENCKWYNGAYCLERELILKFDGMVDHKDFGCNKWEAKK